MGGIWKKLFSFSKSEHSNFSICKVSCKKKKILTFTTKKKMLYLGIFGLVSGKIFSYLKLTPSSLPKCKDWCKDRNSYIWNQKYLYWVFWTAILKSYIHTWNQHPQICLIAKFDAKIKILKFGTKNAIFRYCRVGIWK